MTIEFRELLKAAVKQFGSQRALAEAIQLDTSRLNRAINKGDHPFNVENCLRLAQVTGLRPSLVLRAADKGSVAELIESLYGKEVDSRMTLKERDHLDCWRKLDPERQRAIDVLTRDRLDTTTTKARRALKRPRHQ